MITFQSQSIPLPHLQRNRLKRWLRNVAQGYGHTIGELAYVFCNDEEILAVNRQYLGHDYYTDIITFPYSEDRELSADIFISLDTIHSNARLFGTDPDEELCRVIVHGLLHLCGINDKGPGEREAMEAAENAALQQLISLHN